MVSFPWAEPRAENPTLTAFTRHIWLSNDSFSTFCTTEITLDGHTKVIRGVR